MVVPRRPFHFWMSLTLVPYFFEILLRVSPERTVWVRRVEGAAAGGGVLAVGASLAVSLAGATLVRPGADAA
jgi:hypothetical protein